MAKTTQLPDARAQISRSAWRVARWLVLSLVASSAVACQGGKGQAAASMTGAGTTATATAGVGSVVASAGTAAASPSGAGGTDGSTQVAGTHAAGTAAPSGGVGAAGSGGAGAAGVGAAGGGGPTAGQSSSSDAQSWTTYGYDAQNSMVNPHETVIGAGNVAMLKERWRVKFPMGGTSTPVVYDGAAYFGGWDGNAYAIDAETGEIRWQQTLTNYLIRSTPLVTEDRVFFAAGPNLVALNRADGKTIFETQLSMHPETVLDSSPKLVDGLVIIGVSAVESSYKKDHYTAIGAIVGIDAMSGSEVWRILTTGEGSGRCVGGPGASVWSSAAIDPELGLAYIGTGQNSEPPASPCADSLIGFHYKRDYQGDRIAWVAQYTAGDVYAAAPASAAMGADADVGASPNLFEAGGKPLVGAGDKGGTYRVFDRRTGEMIWRANLGVGEFSQAGGVRATAAYSNGTIFVATNVLSTISLLTGAIVGSSLPGEGANIYALNAETGETRWKQNVGSTIDGSLVIANGVLYHIENNLGFFARDPATGKELWSVTLKLFFGAGPSILNGRIYLSAGYNVASNSTSLPNTDGSQIISFGLDAPTTPKVWQARVDDPEKPFTEPECETAVAMASDWPGGGKPSAACTSCLCQCNATAAGNCDSCWLQAPCAAKSCNLSQPGNDMHLCMSLNCEGKLVPGYVFEDSVQVAPCAVKCATMCGFN